MLHLPKGSKEYELAEQAFMYIDMYLKNPGETVCYVPYVDDMSGETKQVKFELINGQWIFVENN